MQAKQAKTESPIYTITATALVGVEASIKERVVSQLNARLATMTKALGAVGMDAKAVYDYPSSTKTPSRTAYIRAVADYNFCRSHFTALPNQRNWRNEPMIVALREDSAATIDKEAAEYAKAATVAFIHKLTGKMEKHLEAHPEFGKAFRCEHLGNMWDGSTVIYHTQAGMVRWATQTIINVSVLGKLFNQFPTRLIK